MNKITKKKLYLLLLIVFLVSCSPSPKAFATQTAGAWTPTPKATATPLPTPTLVPSEDYDGDSLTNIDEMEKYLTNPYEKDSDGDGIFDDDWNEKREYVYSVFLLVKLRQPFDVDAMNDSFQDTRVISEEDSNGYTTLEINIYPETEKSFNPSPYPLVNLSSELLELTKPGVSTNYSEEMKDKVFEIVKNANTDQQAVQYILNWTESNTELADLPYQPEVFYFSYLSDEEVKLRNPPSLPISRMLDELLFADSMFSKKVHGTCCSTATFKCGMIKAAGIPCKVIQTLFPIFSHEDQKEEYINKLKRKWVNMFEAQPSGTESIWANHCFMEVYLGDRWVRVDNKINIYHESYGWLSFKIISVSDLIDVDFSKTYPADWINNRPYYTLLIEDQEPVH